MNWFKVILCIGVIPLCLAMNGHIPKFRRFAPQSNVYPRNFGSLPLENHVGQPPVANTVSPHVQQGTQAPHYQQTNFQAPVAGLNANNVQLPLEGELTSFPPDIPVTKTKSVAHSNVPSAVEFHTPSQPSAQSQGVNAAILNVEFEPSLPPAVSAPQTPTHAPMHQAHVPDTNTFVPLPPPPPAQRPRVHHHSLGRGAGYVARTFPTVPPVTPTQPSMQNVANAHHTVASPVYVPQQPVQHNVHTQAPQPAPVHATQHMNQIAHQQQASLTTFAPNQMVYSPNVPVQQQQLPLNVAHNQQQLISTFAPAQPTIGQTGDLHQANQPNQGAFTTAQVSGGQGQVAVGTLSQTASSVSHGEPGNHQQAGVTVSVHQDQPTSVVPPPVPEVAQELPTPAADPNDSFATSAFIGNNDPQKEHEQIFNEELSTISQAVFGDGLLTPEGVPPQSPIKPPSHQAISQEDEVGHISSFSYFSNPFDSTRLRYEAARTVHDKFQEFMTDKTGFPGTVEPEKSTFTGYANARRKSPSTKYGVPKATPLSY